MYDDALPDDAEIDAAVALCHEHYYDDDQMIASYPSRIYALHCYS